MVWGLVMKLSPLHWFVAAQAVALICLVDVSSADNPPVEKKAADPPAAALPRQGITTALSRELEASRFIREFERSSSGVDLTKELKLTADQVDKLLLILAKHSQQIRGEAAPAFPQGSDPAA